VPPTRLAPYAVDSGSGLSRFTGQETLPEIMVVLADRRGPKDPGPMLRFLTLVSGDPATPAPAALAGLRDTVAQLGEPDPGRTAVAADSRLVVQIRLEALDAEHIDNGRYLLRSAYYWQPLPSGPLRRINILGETEPFAKSELIGAGSARLAGWTDLARAVRGAGGGKVRVEFLLPSSLLSHEAELWKVGSGMPMGHHHPVVVRSLERYSDDWIDRTPWHERWSHVRAGSRGTDVLDRIEWPALQLEQSADLADWLAAHPELACMGLASPYDALAGPVRDAVQDALLMEGVPVMLWRRTAGHSSELVEALREHSPECLADLPETVRQCRKAARHAGEADVRNNITLLWDDPECVDPEQDRPYEGMV
jgi:hypothetical protein